MPIHVDIRINERLINQIHIGRLSGGTGADDVNTYLAVEGDQPLVLPEWKQRGVEFEHRYGDGAEKCIELAIVALRDANE